MFTYDTFLSSFDRLSTKSTTTGKTGTVFGILGSLAFVVICFILFIGPVVNYFKGDYVQGIFNLDGMEEFQQYSTQDFKLSISFYQKSTGQLADHEELFKRFKGRVYYITPNAEYLYTDIKLCSSEYFQGLTQVPHQFNSKDCFIIPDYLEFASSIDQGSAFGFNFQLICDNPFMCSLSSSQVIQQKDIQFFQQHYYILRFTAKNINRQGEATMKLYQAYSTQFQGENGIIPVMLADLEKHKIYLDNSIMPWFNNITKNYTSWLGITRGDNLDTSGIQISGLSTYLTTSSYRSLYFREYKKLDWLLGMLGGGLSLLFLFFWIPCHYVAVIKQKVQQCQSIMLISQNNRVYKPKFKIMWYISHFIHINFGSCWQKQKKIMREYQRYIDIAELIKKLKTTVKNIKETKDFFLNFEPRTIVINNIQNQNYNQQQLNHQLPSEILNKVRNQDRIPVICDNNLSMMTLYTQLIQQEEKKTQMQEKLKNIQQSQVYSKTSIPNLQSQNRSGCAEFCNGLLQMLISFIKKFDIFGAKPNFTSEPYNNSGVGCGICLLICLLSFLTFGLTMANMSKTRTYWDQIYIAPQQQKVNVTTGKQFKALLCLTSYAFIYQYVVSQNRYADVKFYQYKRVGSTYTYEYINAIVASVDDNTYFNTKYQYDYINLNYCFRPINNVKLEIYGDSNSNQEAFVGFIIKPYCHGTAQYCASRINTTYANFYQVINVFPMRMYLPRSKYYPDRQQTIVQPQLIYFSEIVRYIDLQFTKPVEQNIFMDTLQIVNDQKSWMTGNTSVETKQFLSFEASRSKSHYSTYQDSPFYRLKLSLSGKVQRIIFSNYKIDFLFGVIGGCFVFFYFFLGCLGKAYNNYKIKTRLIQILYNEDLQEISTWKYFFNWARVFCCQDEIIQKIQTDIDCVNLSKKVDSMYRLSACKYESPLEKDLSLIYLKQKINQTQRVIIHEQEQKNPEKQQGEDDDFDMAWNNVKRQKQGNENKNAVANDMGQSNSQNCQSYLQQDEMSEHRKHNLQSLYKSSPSLRDNQKYGRFINTFDFYQVNPQLTLDGQRSIRSVFGGICCLLLTAFTIILTSHYLFLYSRSDYHRVSLQKIVDQSSQIRQLNLQVGKDFKLALSFNKYDDFKFQNVSDLVDGYITFSLIKYKAQKINGQNVQSQVNQIELKKCNKNYFEGFFDSQARDFYYQNFTNGYCVPDGTLLNLYGSTNDQKRQFFSLKMYNTLGNTIGNTKMNSLLSTYVPRFHISNPIVDYRKDGYIRYHVQQFSKYLPFSSGYSQSFNITITKNIILYDTAVNPSNQKLTLHSYSLNTPEKSQFKHEFSSPTNVKYELFFYAEEMYNEYTIKTMKINQVFGLIGGCIVFVFFLVGCIPRSFNQFKMRYKIGTKLYTIIGRKTVNHIKNIKGKKIVKQQSKIFFQQYSQFGLFRAWILSFWGFFQKNYNTNDTMRHYYLIESRVSKDMNIFQFMKTLHSCQDILKQQHKLPRTDLNLCTVHPKNVLYLSKDTQQYQANLISQIKQNHKQLVLVNSINNFSSWELYKIIQAKSQMQDQVDTGRIPIQKIFRQRWLDTYFKISRPSTINSQSQTQTQLQSQLHSSTRSIINNQIDQAKMKSRTMIRVEKSQLGQQEYSQNFQNQQIRSVRSVKTIKISKKLLSQFDQVEVLDD